MMSKKVTTLQRELEDLKAQITALETSLAEKPDYGMGKGDPAITRWEMDQAMLKRLQERVASLKQSIARIQQGTYGTCEQCGGSINPERLAILPDTKICIRCAQS
jgi:RNA polymerase-binding transcription factor DksA